MERAGARASTAGDVIVEGVGFVGLGGGTPSPVRTRPSSSETEEARRLLARGLAAGCRGSLQGPALPRPAPRHPPRQGLRGRARRLGGRARGSCWSGAVGLCLCGHIHESAGEEPVDGTLCVNLGPFKNGHCALVEIADAQRPRALEEMMNLNALAAVARLGPLADHRRDREIQVGPPRAAHGLRGARRPRLRGAPQRTGPKDPAWMDRDRFVLSAGHGCMLLYSLLHLSGYDLSLEDLKSFRQLGSKTPGHPECGWTPGVEATAGPLGQGLANGVGMAIAERMLAATFNTAAHTVIDHWTYVLASDGDMMEGVASEAASIAGHLRPGKACRVLRLQPHHHRGIHGPRVLRGCLEAVRGLWLAHHRRAACTTSRASRGWSPRRRRRPTGRRSSAWSR